MTLLRERITIVGASLAGYWAAETLRRDGFEGLISLVGDEQHEPYDRPPLSKKYLAGDVRRDQLALGDVDKLDALDLDLRLGQRATGLDVASQLLEVNGVSESYDGLILATGARCRTLPSTDGVMGVHTLRTLDDAEAIRTALQDGAEQMVVVGAGFVGAEVAATAVNSGMLVTMVEALEAPFSRVLGQEMGMVLADLHRSHGVDLRTGVGVDEVLTAPTRSGGDRVVGVRLVDGTEVSADLLVAGIGVIPNVDWMEGSGLDLVDGVVCDATCLAAPNVVAAGDVARWFNVRYGESMRVEHWDNAVQQGAHAARRLLQTDEEAQPFNPVPWFWSDQYDRKVQLAGRSSPDADVRVMTGSVDEHRFVAFYGHEGRFLGALGMNRPRHVMQSKGLLEQDVSWDEALAFAAEWD
ncbi:MAG: FAD-dependent oxidoreductase [Acidimicrobiales bacterium]|nr:FAD-dependent oxidoreductase [Acidimicrobiales bacterium]